jgi:hypothetical protein
MARSCRCISGTHARADAIIHILIQLHADLPAGRDAVPVAEHAGADGRAEAADWAPDRDSQRRDGGQGRGIGSERGETTLKSVVRIEIRWKTERVVYCVQVLIKGRR